MRRRLLIVAVGCIAAVTLSAQTAPTFEVASVKPNNSGSDTRGGRFVKGTVTLTNMPVRELVSSAFGVRLNRVLGGPGWIDSERFDISARAPENTSDEQLPLMLRALLVQRFNLVVHTEAREQPAYALVRAHNDGRLGPKLIASRDCDKTTQFTPRAPESDGKLPLSMPCGFRRWNDGRETVIRAGAQPIAPLVRALEFDRQVLDRTELTGTFTFEVRFAPPNLSVSNNDSGLPSLSSALEEQLGLKLDSTRAPVDHLIIDSIARPTPN